MINVNLVKFDSLPIGAVFIFSMHTRNGFKKVSPYMYMSVSNNHLNIAENGQIVFVKVKANLLEN